MLAVVTVGAAAFALAAPTSCSLETPAMPSYQKDVRPIFMSHCVRCHGAGGTLQGDPNNYPLGTPPELYTPGAPSFCHLNVYDDQGDCTADMSSCKAGAHSCATTYKGFMVGYLHAQEGGLPMPPPPAPRLTDWELEVVDRWLANPIP
jgi:hypothetical protein